MYIYSVKKPIKDSTPVKRIHAVFYATESGNEPAKEALLELGRPTKTVVGEDIRFVELNWRVDRMSDFIKRLFELASARSQSVNVRAVVDIEYRTLFFVSGSQMVLVHFFKKTSRKTPKSDLDLGWDRMKKWVHAEKTAARKTKKGQKSHAQKK